MHNIRKISCLFLLLLFAAGCLQKFQPTLNSPPTGYLVVEGIINSNGPATVNLSRTTMLSDTSVSYEAGAMVQVEGNDNSVYGFTEKGNGVYGIDQLSLNTAGQYRLRITTTAGKVYLSDYAPVRTTPPVDSINWQQSNGGVQIYANTHDPMNNTIYYKWDYVETWEFHSPYAKFLSYDTVIDVNGNPEPGVYSLQDQDLSIYTCWKSQPSTQILVSSTAALSSDVIYDFPLSFIPPASIELSVEYSILVNQYALTADAYNFLQIMKKNTEETGSIFGSQPSQLQGNVHCVSAPTEIVVGYVGFASLESKRIFINNIQLPGWLPPISDCTQDSILTYNGIDKGDPYGEINNAFRSGLLPTTPLEVDFATGAVLRFLAAPAVCVDCTLTGTNQKPSFWQ